MFQAKMRMIGYKMHRLRSRGSGLPRISF